MNDFDPKKLRNYVAKKKNKVSPSPKYAKVAAKFFVVTLITTATVVPTPSSKRTQQTTNPSLNKKTWIDEGVVNSNLAGAQQWKGIQTTIEEVAIHIPKW